MIFGFGVIIYLYCFPFSQIGLGLWKSVFCIIKNTKKAATKTMARPSITSKI